MQYRLTAEQEAFRERVKAFVDANLDPDVAAKVKRGAPVTREETRAWTKLLNSQGWSAPGWPREHGGPGWSLVERHLFDVVLRQAHAPVLNGASFNMVGPAICRYGSDEMRARFLPRILSGEMDFCQGYSEPQAGSDLASLKTRAERDGDDYVVNGHKIWTSGAESADWIFILVRTNDQAKPQRGISFLILDMKSPGITVKPLYAFNGKLLWNQVFFDDVRVPVSQRLGEEDKGWTVAKSLLGDERLFVSRVAENKRIHSVLRDALDEMAQRGITVEEDVHKDMDELAVRLLALETMSLRVLTDADAGGDVGAVPSMLKLKGSQLIQDQDEVLFRLIDHLALPCNAEPGEVSVGPPFAEYVASGRYHHRGYTIAGGSSEIQQNIIAKEVLGL